MFNWLQNKLGITDLQQQIGKHHTQVEWEIVTERWKHVAQRLADIDDHLLEMKEMVKKIDERDAVKLHTPFISGAWPVEGDLSIAPVSPKPKVKKIRQQIIDCLRFHSENGMHYLALAQSLARGKMEISVVLSEMVRKGIIVRLKPGVYALPKDAPLTVTGARGRPKKMKEDKKHA